MGWRCVVRLGEVVVESVQLAPGADPDTDPPLPVLLEARWTDELDTDQHTWPLVQGPSTARLALLMADAADAADITADTTVSVEFYRQAADVDPVATFHGRASAPNITPHDLGVVVEVTCADYLTDLAAVTIGSVAYPAETTDLRMGRMFAAAGETMPEEWSEDWQEWRDFPTSATSGPGLDGAWPTLAARAASATSLLAEAQAVLADSVWVPWQFITEGLSTWRDPIQYELRPNITDGELDPILPWQIVRLDPEVLANAPLRFVRDGDTWTALPAEEDPEVLEVLVPASVTDWSATWSRRVVADVNTVDVVLADETIRRSTNLQAGQVRVTDRVETTLTGGWHSFIAQNSPGDPGTLLGNFLLPDRLDLPGSSWEADRFTVLLDEAQAPADWWPGELREVRTLSSIQARHNPEGRTWWTGVVAFREVSVAGGECRVEVGLLPRPITAREWFGYPFTSIDIGELPTVEANRAGGAPSFENGLTEGWVGASVVAVQLDAGVPGAGAYVGRFTFATTSAVGPRQEFGAPAAPGEVWTAVVWLRSRVGARFLRSRLRFVTSTGTTAGVVDSAGVQAPSSGPFVARWVTATAPAGAVEVEVNFVATSGAVGDQVEVAAAMLVPGAVVPTEYVDASMATPTFANVDPALTISDAAQIRS